VTAEVTRETLAIQAEHALLALETVTNRVGRALTVDVETTPPSPALRRRIAKPSTEPHRQFLLHVARRLQATRLGDPSLA
jgi:phosphoenolpyruvate carboxylase